MSTTSKFRKALKKVPPKIRELAEAAIKDPSDPRWGLKKLQPAKRLKSDSYRLRITNQNWRAIGKKTKAGFEWYWLGTHEDYNGMTG